MNYSFLKVLFDTILPLQEFLNHEFSAENITFWTSCEQYRHLAGVGEQARRSAASAIAERHLAPGCPEPVNVDAAARQVAKDGLSHAGPDIFAPAQKHIYNLMKFDSYSRQVLASKQAMRQVPLEHFIDIAVDGEFLVEVANQEWAV